MSIPCLCPCQVVGFEAQIADGIRAAYHDDQQVIEGSGAVGIAALRAGLIDNPGRTVALTTGCNIDMALHKRIVGGEDVDLMAE